MASLARTAGPVVVKPDVADPVRIPLFYKVVQDQQNVSQRTGRDQSPKNQRKQLRVHLSFGAKKYTEKRGKE